MLLSPRGAYDYNERNQMTDIVASAKERNTSQESSPFTVGVAAGHDQDLSGLFSGRKCCRLIENMAAGKIHYVSPDGFEVLLDFQLPAAVRFIEAQKILAGTTCDLIVYF